MHRTWFVMALALLLGAGTVEAQEPGERPTREERRERLAQRLTPVPMVGVRAGYDFDLRDFSLGAQAQLPVSRLLRFVPSGDVYLGDETTWQLNADLALSLLVFRAGGGLALVDGARTTGGDAELGLNLFAGIQSAGLRGTRIRPFAEARWTFIEDATPVRIVAGVNVPVGSR
jgi:hypothetical protein